MKNKIVSIIIKIVIIVIIISIGVLAAFIYTRAHEGDNKEKSEKIEKEIVYLDSKITNIMNAINGIELANYKITVNEVKEDDEKNNASEKEGSDKEKEQNNESNEETSKNEEKISKIEQEQIIANKEEINWQWIQGETEMLYTIWPNIILDLYEEDINTDKIVTFSTAMDEALIGVQKQDKSKTLTSFAKMYNILQEFSKNMDEIQKLAIKVKSNILEAYANIDNGDWQKIENEVQSAEKEITKFINTLNKDKKQKTYNIDKTYILIEELKNSLTTKDSKIFYLKYKTLIEEMNNLI